MTSSAVRTTEVGMGGNRAVSLTDRWGKQSDDDVTPERFAVLFAELDAGEDDEHSVVAINDENEWYVEFSRTSVTFGNAEADGDEGTLALSDQTVAHAIATQFLAGDLDGLRAAFAGE